MQLPETEYQATWRQLVDMARTAEAVGLDSLWVGDHLLYDEAGARSGPWEAWSVLAGLGAVTTRIDLGPLVAALPFHPPAVLAKQAATIDEISGGRLVFGVGAGWNQVEFAAFGLPFDRRVGRFAEAFEIIRRLLNGERFDYEGDFYTLRDCELIPPPPRPGAMPFMVGSNRPRMLAITLPHVTWWNSWYTAFDNEPARLPALVRQIEQACHRASRNPATLKKSIAVYIGTKGKSERRTGGNPWSGTTAEQVEMLRTVAAAGIDEVQGILEPITAESIELYGELVAAFRSAG